MRMAHSKYHLSSLKSLLGGGKDWQWRESIFGTQLSFPSATLTSLPGALAKEEENEWLVASKWKWGMNLEWKRQ